MLKFNRRSPPYVFIFLALLILPQVMAMRLQWHRGFLPFKHEPQRVPFSWDMFSNRVERCIVSWSHPLHIGEHKISSLRDVEIPFEWDVIFDHVEDYRAAAQGLCRFSVLKPNLSHLDCFLPSGVEVKDEFSCP